MNAFLRNAVVAAGICVLPGCGLLGPAPTPTAPTNPMAGAVQIGTTTIVPVDAPAGIGLWTAQKGDNAEQMLKRWAATAGYTVVWRAGKRPLLGADAAIAGTFTDAVTVAINEGWPTLTPRLLSDIYTKNNVVVVTQDAP